MYHFFKQYSSYYIRIMPSVVPSDRNFSTLLFLTLVHGSISFTQLRLGLDHLREHLMQQSSRRENLVRQHFGLFVQCADGLEFLKAYRKGGKLLLLGDLHYHIYIIFYIIIPIYIRYLYFYSVILIFLSNCCYFYPYLYSI